MTWCVEKLRLLNEGVANKESIFHIHATPNSGSRGKPAFHGGTITFVYHMKKLPLGIKGVVGVRMAPGI